MWRTWLLCVDRFFFFQAEDGIRDVAVTGVQTCALPIFGGGVGIRIALEPVDKSGALRNFVRDLAVVALEFADECQSGTHRGKIAGGVQGERGPEGIAAEKPGEARALGLARSAVAGNKPGAEIRIADPSLELADARPIVSLLQLRVGKLKADRAREIVLVVFPGFFEQCGVVCGQMLVHFFRRGAAFHRGGDNDEFCLFAFFRGAKAKGTDRKSTRLNSSHGYISYAVFCLKKKKNTQSCGS